MTVKSAVNQGNEGLDLGLDQGLETETEMGYQVGIKTESAVRRENDASAKKRNENVDARRKRR